MKRVILIIQFVCIIGFLFGQEQFKNGEMKIGSEIYEVRINDKSPIIGISNLSKNVKEVPRPLSKGEHDPLPIHDKDVYVDTAIARIIIVGVLKDRLLELKRNKDYIWVRYIFYPDGRIMNIDYIVPQNTLISPKEMAEIDQRLRKDIRVRLTGKEYRAFPAIHYNRQKKIHF